MTTETTTPGEWIAEWARLTEERDAASDRLMRAIWWEDADDATVRRLRAASTRARNALYRHCAADAQR